MDKSQIEKVMNNLHRGDYIVDLHMTRVTGQLIVPTITEIDRKRRRLVCKDWRIPIAYPHAFYEAEHGIKWVTGLDWAIFSGGCDLIRAQSSDQQIELPYSIRE